MDLAVRTIEIGGFVSSFTAMRLPFNSAKKSDSAGSVSAMNPISYSEFRIDHTYNFEIGESDLQLAQKLILNGDEHSKFIRGVVVWCSIDAPRYWWQDADTYRISSKQSQSTNHTILKRGLTVDDFEDKDISPEYLYALNTLIRDKDFFMLKKHLPEGFMQKREWCMSYKTLGNIINQRYNHLLPHWKRFIDITMEQIFINLMIL